MIAHFIAGLFMLQTTRPAQAPSSGTTTLISLYDSTQDSDSKETIVRYLGERDDAAAIAKLEAIAKSDPDSDLRETAIRHLARRF